MHYSRLSHEQIQAIVDHAVNGLPNEVCGLIAGRDGKAKQIVPIKNVADKPQQQYQMDAQEQLQALKSFDEQNIDWIAVYHSHPNGQPLPSSEDIRDADLNTPNIYHLIIGLKNQKVRLQAWRIHDGQVDEVELLVGQQQSNSLAPMSQLQIWAIIVAIIIAVILLLGISFSLLPPAPPLPTPQ